MQNIFKTEYLFVENVLATGTVEPPVDLEEMVRTYPDVRYRYENFPSVYYYMKAPRATLRFFDSGKINIASRTELYLGKVVREMEKKLTMLGTKHKIHYTIKNVTCSGGLNEGLECGVLRSIFPDSKKALGEGVRVYVKGKKGFSIYPSGKIISFGFTSYGETDRSLKEVLEKINRNLDRAMEEKTEVCFIERGEPLISSFYKYLSMVDKYVKAKGDYVHHLAREARNEGLALNPFTDEERLRGRFDLERFLEIKSREKNNLGATVETIAAAEIYRLGRLNRRFFTQHLISEACDIAEPSLRNGHKLLEQTLIKEKPDT
jgi:hypothetical protein